MSDLAILINGELVTADMATWRQVRAQIAAREIADWHAWEQRQREAGQVWIAIYWQHREVCTEECLSLEDAVAYLEAGSEGNYLAAAGIRLPDGQLVGTEGSR